jgi:hypothetical protein
MSAQALAGLAGLNALYLSSGIALVWLVRGLATWTEAARLAGLAFLLGVVVTGGAWTMLLVAGVPFGLWAALAVPLAVAAGSLIAAVRRGRVLPRRRPVRIERRHFVAAVGIAATGVLLEAFFRVSRLSGLYWWDAWSFWVPKAKAIYYFGEFDADFLATLPAGSSYPPLVPVLDAAAFHAMGGADVVTLHVQYWILGVGLVWALAGLLAERVPPWILWPFMLLLLVAPRIGPRLYITEADLFLDSLFVLAAVLVLQWLTDRQLWRLVFATTLMGGMVLTKREGMLLVALLVLSAALAAAREWRYVLPRLGVAAVIVAVVAAPWRIWYIARGVTGEAPPGGGIDPTANTERLWPSFRLAFDVLFSGAYWSVAVTVAIAALALALLARAYRPALFFGSLVLLVTLGGGWITWAVPELPITQELGGNPIVRYMGAAALACLAAAPFLLATAWSRVTSEAEAQ